MLIKMPLPLQWRYYENAMVIKMPLPFWDDIIKMPLHFIDWAIFDKFDVFVDLYISDWGTPKDWRLQNMWLSHQRWTLIWSKSISSKRCCKSNLKLKNAIEMPQIIGIIAIMNILWPHQNWGQNYLMSNSGPQSRPSWRLGGQWGKCFVFLKLFFENAVLLLVIRSRNVLWTLVFNALKVILI